MAIIATEKTRTAKSAVRATCCFCRPGICPHLFVLHGIPPAAARNRFEWDRLRPPPCVAKNYCNSTSANPGPFDQPSTHRVHVHVIQSLQTLWRCAQSDPKTDAAKTGRVSVARAPHYSVALNATNIQMFINIYGQKAAE
jgi:hypothetical protein